jgi:hypothetical protein
MTGPVFIQLVHADDDQAGSTWVQVAHIAGVKDVTYSDAVRSKVSMVGGTEYLIPLPVADVLDRIKRALDGGEPGVLRR